MDFDNNQRVRAVVFDAVIRAGGGDPDAVLKNPTRERVGPYIVRGAQKILLDLVLKNHVHALLAMGGRGRLVSVMTGDAFRATTGAQVPIDGGMDRVI